MTALEAQSRQPWHAYRDSLPPHLLDLGHHLQTRMMTTLQRDLGHRDLRLGFAAYITLVGERNLRPTELAELLGISRQACNQALRQIEAAGYISYIPDPEDGRAKLLTLTDNGRKLRRDGVDVVAGLDEELTLLVGAPAARQAADALARLTVRLGLGPAENDSPDRNYRGIGGLLPRLGDYILHRLMELTRGKGHPDLKLSFGQVIPHIGPEGGRIRRIAAIQDVSKQAISAIATELEELGYLWRDDDPDDARQVLLRFTRRGEELMTDSTGSVEKLAAEFADLIGAKELAAVSDTLRALHRGLGLGSDAPEDAGQVDIRLLAKQLKEQLGVSRSQALGRLLTDAN